MMRYCDPLEIVVILLPTNLDYNKNTYLHAFGNKSAPRPPREGKDIEVTNGFVEAQPTMGKKWPQGASTFADITKAQVTGHYHQIPRETQMPKGLGVIADGKDVGGPRQETHHTIYPLEKMLFSEFSQLFSNLPWEYGGKK